MSSEKQDRTDPRFPSWARLVAIGVLGGVVAVLSLALVPPKTEIVGAAKIAAKVEAGSGGTDVLIPPLGEIQANTHKVPLSFAFSLVEVDVQELGDAISAGVQGTDFTRQLESGLRTIAIQVAIRSFVAALIAGAIAAALLPHRHRSTILSGAAGGGICVGALLLVAGITYEVEAFEQPRFTGALTRAPIVIEALNSEELSLSDVQTRFQTAAGRLRNLLALLAEPNPDPRNESVAVLHISDIHTNPIGLEITRQLAERFDVDAIVDTGDLTNFGLELETEFAALVRDMPAPYYYVSGNHDSVDVQARMDRLPNVTVMHGRVADIRGVTFFGWPDPTYTNWNLLPPQEAAEVRIAAGAELAEELSEVDPDVLMVHDRRTAGEAFGVVPLILAGHNHRQITEERAGTRLLAVGSTGAAGLQSFTVEADLDYEAEIVYLRGDQAVAYDYVTFSGLGGDFDIKRRTLEPLGPLVPPGASPSPTPSPSPAPSG